jgi:hypothetical protein
MLDLDAQEVDSLNVKLGGKVVGIKYPTFEQLNSYTEDYNNKELNQTETLKNFLKGLGLNDDLFKLLNSKKLELLIGELTGVKKQLPSKM